MWKAKRNDTEDSFDALERNLYNWQAGNLPSSRTIQDYFSDNANPVFEGVFQLEEGLNEHARFIRVLEFVKNTKQLNVESLRDQVSMTQPGRLEAKIYPHGRR